jgi:hypothetical protein
MARRLQPEELRRRCDPEIFGVETTAECKPLDDVIGQERALRALELGLGIKDFRYNIYVAGSPAQERTPSSRHFSERSASKSLPHKISAMFIISMTPTALDIFCCPQD